MSANRNMNKTLDTIQTVTVLSVMCLLASIIWYSSNTNGLDKLEFWVATSVTLIFLMDAFFTFKRGHGWAKGLRIDKVNSPTLFYANFVISLSIATLGIVGVFYYW